LANQFGGTFAFVEGDIVEDDDIAGFKFRPELGLDVGFEPSRVHWCVNDPGRNHGMTAQSGDAGLGLLPAERRVGSIALPFR
jgi:hypothetical protein